MPLLLEDLAEETSAGNRRAAERLDAEAHDLDQPNSNGVSIQDRRRKAAESARQATDYALSRLPQAEGVWRLALQTLHKNPLGEEANRLLAALQKVFESGQSLVRSSRALWKNAEQLETDFKQLAELDRAEKRFDALAAEATLAVTSRKSDWQPADPARFALGMQLSKDDKAISAQDAVARFRHGRS